MHDMYGHTDLAFYQKTGKETADRLTEIVDQYLGTPSELNVAAVWQE